MFEEISRVARFFWERVGWQGMVIGVAITAILMWIVSR